MTEEQARQKLCPLFHIAGCICNRGASTCEASQCMMWRWERDRYAEGYAPGPEHEDYKKGYCGLAGRT